MVDLRSARMTQHSVSHPITAVTAPSSLTVFTHCYYIDHSGPYSSSCCWRHFVGKKRSSCVAPRLITNSQAHIVPLPWPLQELRRSSTHHYILDKQLKKICHQARINRNRNFTTKLPNSIWELLKGLRTERTWESKYDIHLTAEA